MSAVDYFAALGLPREAAMEADAVREAFQAASKAAHPDVGGDAENFERLNRANSTLSQPVSRLRHLAELEFGEPPGSSGAVSAETMALFETVGSALADADAFSKARAGATTAIAKALMAKRETEASAAVFAANGAVRARRLAAEGEIAAIDTALKGGDRERAERLIGESLRELAFLAKWEAQLGERMAALLAEG